MSLESKPVLHDPGVGVGIGADHAPVVGELHAQIEINPPTPGLIKWQPRQRICGIGRQNVALRDPVQGHRRGGSPPSAPAQG